MGIRRMSDSARSGVFGLKTRIVSETDGWSLLDREI